MPMQDTEFGPLRASAKMGESLPTILFTIQKVLDPMHPLHVSDAEDVQGKAIFSRFWRGVATST